MDPLLDPAQSAVLPKHAPALHVGHLQNQHFINMELPTHFLSFTEPNLSVDAEQA